MGRKSTIVEVLKSVLVRVLAVLKQAKTFVNSTLLITC